jgi:predicted transglutaminase-like cysteine proteinase
MSSLRQAQRAVVTAVGLGIGLLICLDTAVAQETGALSLGAVEAPLKTLEVRMASIAPVQTPKHKPAYRSAEPFGLETSPLAKGGLREKWSGVTKKLPREALALLRCRANPGACTPAAKRFLAVVDKAATREGWTRIAEVNRAINLSIKGIGDMTQYGVRDLWASPLMTFGSGAGDCEDYAIAKYVALREQ